MNWLAAQRRALRLALQRLAATPLNSFLSILGIGLVLALPASGYVLLKPGAQWAQGGRATPQITLFLHVGAARSVAEAVEARLKTLPEVRASRLVAREDTLARMKQVDGLADAIGVLPGNPFPDAIVATPADVRPEALEALATSLRQWNEVEQLQVDADWARQLAAFVRLAQTGLLLLAGLLGLGALAIVFNTVRQQAESRRTEVEVSRLLGATDAFVRRPFLWHGALLGLSGGGVAWLCAAGAALQLQQPVGELARLYAIDLPLALPGGGETLVLLGLSAGFGWLGAWLSIRPQLRS